MSPGTCSINICLTAIDSASLFPLPSFLAFLVLYTFSMREAAGTPGREYRFSHQNSPETCHNYHPQTAGPLWMPLQYMFFSVQMISHHSHCHGQRLQCRISTFVIHIQKPFNFNNNNNEIVSGVYFFIPFTELIICIYIFWVVACL